MTPQQLAGIKAAAEKTYRELFGPASAEQLATVGAIIGPVWRQMAREAGERPEELAAAEQHEAA